MQNPQVLNNNKFKTSQNNPFNFLDIDECERSESICGQNAKCLNQYGSYTCECLAGFLPNYSAADGFKCDDQDECASQCHNDCDRELAICVNLAGSFDCACKPGFSGTGKVCQDIDECRELPRALARCGPNAVCVNTRGGFECQCQRGFSRDL